MEFPDLGKHCSEKTCKQLDFLPLKCNACEEVFCKNHIAYNRHKCAFAYTKDVQVPICPLCNSPIPVRKGESPDAVVGVHMDRDCKRDSVLQKPKIFVNRCFQPGCKKKEMMQLVCDQCHQNFCLQHRHPLDHVCQGQGRPMSKAGCAALMRSLDSNKMMLSNPLLQGRGKVKS
ncbi:AN1-type zinc finger protein 2A [Varanus komodoensis]|nr:AN1-type zinc finger protein 2A [Varanus komodoensis]